MFNGKIRENPLFSFSIVMFNYQRVSQSDGDRRDAEEDLLMFYEDHSKSMFINLHETIYSTWLVVWNMFYFSI